LFIVLSILINVNELFLEFRVLRLLVIWGSCYLHEGFRGLRLLAFSLLWLFVLLRQSLPFRWSIFFRLWSGRNIGYFRYVLDWLSLNDWGNFRRLRWSLLLLVRDGANLCRSFSLYLRNWGFWWFNSHLSNNWLRSYNLDWCHNLSFDRSNIGKWLNGLHLWSSDLRSLLNLRLNNNWRWSWDLCWWRCWFSYFSCFSSFHGCYRSGNYLCWSKCNWWRYGSWLHHRSLSIWNWCYLCNRSCDW